MKEIVSAVTSKGQVTIPAEVRRHLGLKTPDKVAFVIDGEGKVAVAAPHRTLEGLFGSIPPLSGRDTVDFDDQIEEGMEDEADRIVRDMGGR